MTESILLEVISYLSARLADKLDGEDWKRTGNIAYKPPKTDSPTLEHWAVGPKKANASNLSASRKKRAPNPDGTVRCGRCGLKGVNRRTCVSTFFSETGEWHQEHRPPIAAPGHVRKYQD
jgi:hypothetical protein